MEIDLTQRDQLERTPIRLALALAAVLIAVGPAGAKILFCCND